jgi:C-terminal peptidase prc
VVLAYFGEGGPLGESGDRRCYFTCDSTVKGRDKDAVASSEVGDALKNLKSRHCCVLLDVDFKGFDIDGKQAIAEPTLGTPPYPEFLGDDGSEDHNPAPGRVLFLATNGLSRSLDLDKHGVFTQSILDGLKGAADKEGYEPDGWVTVDELADYLDKKLPALTAKYGKTEEEKQQLHFVLGGRANHFTLTHNPAVAGKVRERLDKLDVLAKDGKLPEKFVTEGRTLLERMPRLEAQRSLRKQYQELVEGRIDLDKFQSERDKILDSTKLPRDQAVEYASKVMEIVGLIQERYVKKVDANEMVAWAIRGLYRRADEKIPSEIEDRLKTVGDLKESELAVLLADARQALGAREDLASHKDVDVTLQRMLAHLDPYTTYIDAETLQRFRSEVRGKFTGVGIQIRKDTASDQLLVVTPIKGSAAYEAGVHAGDVITKVTRDVDSEGKPLAQTEVILTKGLPLNAAVKKILGKEGTEVTLTVQRDGKEMDFRLTRGQVNLESVMGVHRKKGDDWEFMLDPESKIGYIRVTTFAQNTFTDLKRAMARLNDAGLKGLVLDLRFNPGGLLPSAVDVTDLFIDDGLIVTIRPRVGRESPLRGHHRDSLLDFPMVCLVNGYSASGSEIVSAALQDHGRALIIGERSYGKGSVQNIEDFDGGEVKFTTASFWRPSGRNLNKASTAGKDEDEWGVKPDQEVKLSRKDRDDLLEHQHEAEIIQAPGKVARKKEFRDRQLDVALEYLRGQIKTAGRSARGGKDG